MLPIILIYSSPDLQVATTFRGANQRNGLMLVTVDLSELTLAAIYVNLMGNGLDSGQSCRKDEQGEGPSPS